MKTLTARDNDDMYTKPKEERLFSTKMVAAYADITDSTAGTWARNNHITLIKKTNTVYGNGRVALWTWEQMRQCADYYEEYHRQQEERKEQRRQLTELKQAQLPNLEEMKAAHPLVTDYRCFNTAWFPETEPVCFADEEEA